MKRLSLYVELRIMRQILIVILLFISTVLSAQQESKIKFNKTSHYFGTFPKSKGKVSHTFEFTNMADQPVVITNVKSSCGCTATDYTRQPVLPGAKGYVKLRFDPARFSGYFSKKVSVYNSLGTQPDYLTVSGRIRINHKVSDSFQYFIGDIKADNKLIAFGDIEKQDHIISREIKMINIMRDSIKVRLVSHPEWLNACEITKEDLTQGDNTRLVAKVKASELPQWGSLNGNVKLEVKRGGKVEVKEIPLSINLIDSFSTLNAEQKAMQPKIATETDTLNLNFKNDKKTVKKIFLHNRGQSDLIIRNVQSTNEDVIIKKFDAIIRSGEKGKMFLFCSSDNAPFEVVVWSNDPDSYKLIIPVL